MRQNEYPNQQEDELPNKELEIAEVEPDEKVLDGMIPLIDLKAMAEEERKRLFIPPVAEA